MDGPPKDKSLEAKHIMQPKKIMGYNYPFLKYQIPSLISGYDYYQFEMSKDDGMEEWRTNLKNVFKKTSTTINQSVLFLYETQVFNFIKIIV